MIRILNKWVLVSAEEYGPITELQEELRKTTEALKKETVQCNIYWSERRYLADDIEKLQKQLLELTEKYSKALQLCIELSEKTVLPEQEVE